MSDAIRVHEGDKEVFDFAVVDRDGNAITVDDVTAVTFVAKFLSVEMTSTLGSGVTSALVDGELVITVTLDTSKTETLSDELANADEQGEIAGDYQFRVTRGSIGPETQAEGVAVGVLKIEGD